MADKASDSTRSWRGRNMVFPLLAIGVLLAVLIGAVMHQLSQPSRLPATPAAGPASPLATPSAQALTGVAAVTESTPRPTATPTLLPTPTAGLPSAPPSPTPRPTLARPDWDQIYATLGASDTGTHLLILHTNDTWGYLDPCG